MRALTLFCLLASCAAEPLPTSFADLSDAGTPAPPLFFAALLPGDLTATVLPQALTATGLPVVPLVLGGQGSWMLVPRVAALTAWPGRLSLKLWLEREGDGYPLPPGLAYAQVQLEPLGPLWVTPELPLALGEPCGAVGHVVQVHAQAMGVGVAQQVLGRVEVTWPLKCP